jgi:hypothetical protein
MLFGLRKTRQLEKVEEYTEEKGNLKYWLKTADCGFWRCTKDSVKSIMILANSGISRALYTLSIHTSKVHFTCS